MEKYDITKDEEEMKVYDLKTVMGQVASCLEKSEKARNDDKYLTCMVLGKFYKVTFLQDMIFIPCPSLESIRRSRQMLQAQGFFPSDKQILKEREKMEGVYKSYVKRRV